MDPTRYLIKATQVPMQADLDKKRMACVVETQAGVMAAIEEAISKLEIEHTSAYCAGLHASVIRGYLASIGSEDTTDGWKWVIWNGGMEMWTFEWRPFEAKDPVTKKAIKTWAMAHHGTSAEEEWIGILAGVMGRWHWRTLDWQSEHDLKEALQDIAMDGYSAKGINEMTGDELLEAIMEEPVQAAKDNFDEESRGVPFGMTVMLKEDRELWFGER